MSRKLIIVDTPECPLKDVVSIITGKDYLSLLYDKWADVAMDLDIPGDKIKDLKKKSLHDDIGLKGILKEMVELWVHQVEQNGKNASLEDFLKAFRNNEMNKLAKTLETQFPVKSESGNKRKRELDGVEKLRSEETLKSVLNREEIDIHFDSVDGKNFPKDAIVLPKENKGCAFILNIFDFPKGSDFGPRHGSLEDVKQLDKLLTKLGFKTFPKPDIQEKRHKEKKEVLDLIKQFLRFCEDNEAKSVFVFVGSHGVYPNKILTSDILIKQEEKKEKVQPASVDLYKDIVSRFYDNNCPFFKERPKMFLVQACQEFAEISESSSGDGKTDGMKSLDISNMIICLSTHPGGLSVRNEKDGSYLVQFFVRAMKELVGEGKSYQEICNEVVQILTVSSRKKEYPFQVPYYYVVPNDMKKIHFEV